MRRTSAALFTAALALTAPCLVGAQAEDKGDRATATDRQAFDELYKTKLRNVLRTRDKEDDLSLLDDMLATAEEIPDDKGVQGLIYVEAISLAASGADLLTMIEAADLLDKVWPGHEAASVENLIKLAERTYRAAPRDGREEVAKPYLDLLMVSAEYAAEQEDYKRAVTQCRQASQVAKAVDSPLKDDIEALLEYYSSESTITSRIAMLTLAVEKNPKNRPAARELVDLHLVKRNDPTAANKYAEQTGDPELVEMLKLCLKGADKATAAEAQRVGDWYVALSEDQKDEHAITVLTEARVWYGRFLEVYPRKDTLASRVRSMDEVAEGRIERIIAAGVKTTKTAANAGWVNLMGKDFDAKKHVIGREDRIDVNKDGITMQYAMLAVPFKPAKAFEVRVTVSDENRDEFRSTFNLAIPTSETFVNRTFSVRYYPNGRQVARLDDVHDEEQLLDHAPPRKNNTSVLTFQVAEQDNGQLAFAMLVDGKAAMKWQGSPQELNYTPRWEKAEDFGTALVFHSFTKLTIHKVEYRQR